METIKHQIKHRWSGRVLFECDLPSDTPSGMVARMALEKATVRGADLRGAGLRVAGLRGADGEPLRATPEQSIENLDKVRAIILDDKSRLEMGHWHGGNDWVDRTCAEEAVCGTTHCLAGWLQVCSTKPEIRKMGAEMAGILSAPVAAKMFFRQPDEVLSWLETRAYATEALSKGETA